MTPDPYEIFVKEYRDKLIPDFTERQKKAATIICNEIDKINSRGDSCRIENVIDVGCGTGEIITYIKTYYEDLGENITCYGYDSSEYEINEAIRKTKGINFKVLHQNEYVDSEDIDGIDWDKTLLLCLGHTLPHFVNFEKFLYKISKHRPKFIMFDFHDTWSVALDNIVDSVYFEPRHFVDGVIYGLATTFHPENPSLVRRGIAAVYSDTKSNHPVFVVETLQLKKSPEDFIKDIEGQEYCRHTMFSYVSGYGNMHCYLFVAFENKAMKANEIYSKALQDRIIPKVFQSKAVTSALKSLDSLLVISVHPFDSYFTFSEYVPPAPGWPKIELEGSNRLMLVDKIENVQETYPTAYGLFLNTLSEVGGNLIRPLVLTRKGRQNKKRIDSIFSEYEQSLFNSTRIYLAEQIKKVKPSDDNLERSLFVLPVYYGTLPLMFIICKLLGCFSIFNTHQDVFESLLTNLYSAIWKEIDFKNIRNEIIRPIVDDFIYNNPATKEDCVQKDIQRIFKSVETKPWKSWVLSVPSVNINELPQVKLQQGKIYEAIRECVKDAFSDSCAIISKIFQDCEFFNDTPDLEVNTHDKFHPIHLYRIKDFWHILNCDTESDIKTSALLPQKLKNDRCLVPWLQDKLKVIEDETLTLDTKNEAFLFLKSMFCGKRENEKREFRFSIRRIFCYIQIYTNIDAEIRRITKDGRTKIDPSPLSYQTDIDNGKDPTKNIFNLIMVLNEIGIEKVVLYGKKQEGVDYDFIIEINMKSTIKHYSEGQTFKKILEAVNALEEREGTSIDPFKQITISFSVRNKHYQFEQSEMKL